MGKFAILATLFRKYFTEQRMFCNFAVYNLKKVNISYANKICR